MTNAAADTRRDDPVPAPSPVLNYARPPRPARPHWFDYATAAAVAAAGFFAVAAFGWLLVVIMSAVGDSKVSLIAAGLVLAGATAVGACMFYLVVRGCCAATAKSDEQHPR